MPASQAETLAASYAAFRQALDPHDPWANGRLAIVIRAADAAGWSRRSTASALGLSRLRTDRVAAFPATASYRIRRFEPGAVFPAAAVAAFRRYEDEVSLRRIRTERTLIATIRSAHHNAGWPYTALAAIVGASSERLRQIAEIDLDVSAEPAPPFTEFTRVLKDRKSPPPRATRPLADTETERLARLAERAKRATKNVGKRLGSSPRPEKVRELEVSLEDRLASEELSALLISLKNDNVSWLELDTACGYRPGSARARALRHGYAQTPPSMAPYTPTPLPGWPQQNPVSQLTDRSSV
ncbi:hypothetical protein IV500_05490 [Paeniglutamicibacter antarcticus]|uniref:Uncharacterized protein n=2 Tax=Arthrobacter terrae TaxID=2935737 RepID=A0A931CNZ9_9MICC|nr:hypothetical protein [Arthrobacter terrae]